MKKRILTILFLLTCTAAQGQSSVSEDAVKAAFIFHFIDFVEWSDEPSEFHICIPDDANLRTAVSESLEGKLVKNKKILVVNQSDVCHILVSDNVPAADQTLTIGPLEKGALLEFRVVNNKLRFAANLETIRKSKLKISSQLLKLAILDKNS